MKTKHHSLLYLTFLVKHTLGITSFSDLIYVVGAKKRKRQHPRSPFLSDHLQQLPRLTDRVHTTENTLRIPDAHICTAIMYAAYEVASIQAPSKPAVVCTLVISAASLRIPIHGHERRGSASYLMPEPMSLKATEGWVSGPRGSIIPLGWQ